MLTEERHQHILERLEENDIVTINDLMTPLEASESTIRRDLQNLENQGLLVRIHGGAKKLQRLNFEAPMSEKAEKFHLEKKQIAKKAAHLITKENVIYLDAGTTTLAMIPYISTQDNIQVVTNSVKHATLLVERNIKTIILGGSIKLSTHAALGSFTIKQLEQFRFDQAFLGMNGAHLKAGFTTPDPEEAAIKKLAMSQSQQNYVVMDHSKFQQVTFTHVAPLKTATIITDSLPKDNSRQFQSQTKLMEVK
ncbi:MAG TPA: DeoR/GlpR family DNA-binding transcription regulator [Candidatus Tetragenococcus pullicola]|nr:DeoR/GlpR family DNA-binding transcription regulator [Candidatus Tetragenococcus pullicola]